MKLILSIAAAAALSVSSAHAASTPQIAALEARMLPEVQAVGAASVMNLCGLRTADWYAVIRDDLSLSLERGGLFRGLTAAQAREVNAWQEGVAQAEYTRLVGGSLFGCRKLARSPGPILGRLDRVWAAASGAYR